MTAPADSIAKILENVIPEILPKTVESKLALADRCFHDLIEPNLTEYPKMEIGRDMRFKKRFYGSRAGVVQGGHLNGLDRVFGATQTPQTAKFYSPGTARPGPDSRQGAQARFFNLAGTVYNVEASLFIPMELKMVGQHPNIISEGATAILEGFGATISDYIVHSFFANPSEQYRLASLGLESTYAVDTTAKTITFYPPELVANRFKPGLPVDLFSNSTTRKNQTGGGARINCWVHSSDPGYNRVVIQADVDDATFATWSAALGDSGFVVMANTYSGSAGWRSFYALLDFLKWDVNSATAADRQILGSQAITGETLDIADHSEFRSMRWDMASASGVLTEAVLTSHLNAVEGAFDPLGYEIDTLMWSPGVMLGMAELRESRSYFDRTDRPMNAQNQGFKGGMQISTANRDYMGYECRYMEAGRGYGIRRMGNWSVVNPIGPLPGGDGERPQNMMGKFPFQFWGKAAGYASNMIPLTNTTTGQGTPDGEMPGHITAQIWPNTQIPGVIWENVAYTRSFTDGS